jgi:hypothetical protein
MAARIKFSDFALGLCQILLAQSATASVGRMLQ